MGTWIVVASVFKEKREIDRIISSYVERVK